MPSFKLIYFDVRGRGEAIRLLFALAGQKYEDVRIKAEQWPEEKTKIHLGQLPVVEVDGKQLIQTKAIASYLAREFGFYGANSWETAKIDEISGVVEDIWLPLVEIMYGKGDEAEKRDKMKAHFEGKAAAMFQYLEDQLSKNNEGLGFFVGNKISLDDLNFHTSMETIEKIDHPNKGLEKYPKLTALKARISADKALASYLEKRPKSDI